jgi:hypothetical protein
MGWRLPSFFREVKLWLGLSCGGRRVAAINARTQIQQGRSFHPRRSISSFRTLAKCPIDITFVFESPWAVSHETFAKSTWSALPLCSGGLAATPPSPEKRNGATIGRLPS